MGVGLPMPWGWEESLKRRQPALGRNQRNGLWDQAGRQRRGRRPQACTAHVNAPPALMPENRRSVCTGTGVAEVVSPSAPSCPSLFNLHGSRREGDGGFECSSWRFRGMVAAGERGGGVGCSRVWLLKGCSGAQQAHTQAAENTWELQPQHAAAAGQHAAGKRQHALEARTPSTAPCRLPGRRRGSRSPSLPLRPK